jgi:signal transduction histidine kinase
MRMFSASIRELTSQRDAARARVILEERLRQSERLESVGRLVGGIAHDFNNLLAIVLNYTDFVSERLPPDDPNQADLLQIRSAAERATGFTRQLLTFAKRNPVKAEDIDMNAIIGQLRELLRRTLPASIAVDLRLGDGLWSVHADRGQMEQVVLNLVVNASDAMPDGGELVVGTSNVEYDEDSATQHPDLAPGRYVYLTVTDTGAGMTREILDHAFEPFFTTKRTAGEPGLVSPRRTAWCSRPAAGSPCIPRSAEARPRVCCSPRVRRWRGGRADAGHPCHARRRPRAHDPRRRG